MPLPEVIDISTSAVAEAEPIAPDFLLDLDEPAAAEAAPAPLLDEPTLGLAPLMVDRVFEILDDLHKEGTTILLVEQNANLALEVSRFGYVLETGRVLLQDESAKLRSNPQVKSAYLGG